jgi:hypothetical protein
MTRIMLKVQEKVWVIIVEITNIPKFKLIIKNMVVNDLA